MNNNTKNPIISLVLVLCMLITMAAFSGPSLTVGADGAAKTVASSQFTATVTGTIPAGWRNLGPQNVIMAGPSWGQLEANTTGSYTNWGNSTLLIDNVVWDGNAIDLEIAQFQVYGGTGMFYFYYTDATHYYAIRTVGTKMDLIKKDGAADPTVLATGEFTLGALRKMKIVRTAAGAISVDVAVAGAANVYAPLFSPVTDTTFTRGKIGFGFVSGGGYFALWTFKGTEYLIPTPAPTLAPTPAPTVDPSGRVEQVTYTQDFTSPDATETAAWHNVGASAMAINGGMLGGNDWNAGGAPGFIVYSGKTFSGYQKIAIDISASGNATSHRAALLFNVQGYTGTAAYKYYAVKVEGGTGGKISLVKGNETSVWETSQVELGSSTSGYTSNAACRIEVTRGEDGSISVDCIQGGIRTRVISANDTTYTGGYIGAAKWSCMANFDNISVSEKVASSDPSVSISSASVASGKVNVGYSVIVPGASTTCEVIAVGYAANGTCVGVAHKNITAGGGSGAVTGTLQLNGTTAQKVKVFVWKQYGTLVPIARGAEATVN